MDRESSEFALEGKVEPIDDANKRLNALDYRGTTLDMFMLVDATGSSPVYCEPSAYSPTIGEKVRAEGHFVNQRGAGVRRFVASKIERLENE